MHFGIPEIKIVTDTIPMLSTNPNWSKHVAKSPFYTLILTTFFPRIAPYSAPPWITVAAAKLVDTQQTSHSHERPAG